MAALNKSLYGSSHGQKNPNKIRPSVQTKPRLSVYDPGVGDFQKSEVKDMNIAEIVHRRNT
jgi:hypothetical protein